MSFRKGLVDDFLKVMHKTVDCRKWSPEEDDFLKEVVNNYKRGDSIPWSTGIV